MCLLVWGRLIMSGFTTFCTVTDNRLTTKDILIDFAIRLVHINFEVVSSKNSLLFGIWNFISFSYYNEDVFICANLLSECYIRVQTISNINNIIL